MQKSCNAESKSGTRAYIRRFCEIHAKPGEEESAEILYNNTAPTQTIGNNETKTNMDNDPDTEINHVTTQTAGDSV